MPMPRHTPDPLLWQLAAWRVEIDSVPYPELITVEAAVAIVASTARRRRGDFPL